ncbi:DNA sulfur modification protein DndD [Streptomyces sp. NPDC012765]|uniref:DNA sulfur modification protein DndD n=1 Tax=Streptomyces sp. NPDC012765 TaxID=3155249 RepID=UPI0033FD368D
MLLHNITLQDFGAYQGEQTLDLRTQPGRPIVLIGGLNGCGKTTLLDAIQLVLYGTKAECSGRGSRGYHDYLEDCINRKADPQAGAAITLEFGIRIEGEERNYKVIRNWYLTGSKALKESLSVFVNGEFSRAITDSWPDHVETILPIDVASLFFFDGERVEQLADPARAAKVIESAVQSLLGVGAVERLRNDLKALRQRQQLSEAQQEVLDAIQNQQQELEKATEDLGDKYQRLGALNTDLAACKSDLAKIERRFERAGGKAFERSRDLEAERNRIAELATATNKALVSLVGGPLPLLLLGEQLDGVKQRAQIERDADDASRVVGLLEQRDEWLLEQLADSVPAAARTALKRKLVGDRKKRAAAVGAEQSLGLPHDALMQLSALDQALISDSARVRELLKEASDLAEQLESADQQLGAVPEEQVIRDIVAERKVAMAKVAVAQAEKQRGDVEWADAVARKERLKADLDRTQRHREEVDWKSEKLKRVSTYAEKARDTLDKFKTSLLTRNIKNVEVAVLQSFNKLMRKQGLISDIQIDTERFTLVLSDSDGEPIDPGRLSAGERQLLAISLLWGLATAAGNRLPSIIDTPLGRLDSRHRQHLVDRYFPKAGRQVLLLSTDEEIDENLLARLKPYLAHTYTLVHDDTTFTTTVESGYWWTAGAPHVA